MFNSFKRKPPQISIFHHASSPPSIKALELLRSANTAPYPGGSSKTLPPPPLQFNLEVVESPPNKDQLKTILSYMPSQATSPAMLFLSAHPSSASNSGSTTTMEGIVELARKSPSALKWPIVVNWDDGRAAVGDVQGVKAMLEALRRKRDGDA